MGAEIAAPPPAVDVPPPPAIDEIVAIPAGYRAVGRGGERPEDVLYIGQMLMVMYPDNQALRTALTAFAENRTMTPALRTAMRDAIVQFQTDNSIRNRAGRFDGVVDAGTDGTHAPTLTALRAQSRSRLTEAAAARESAAREVAAHEEVHAAPGAANPNAPAGGAAEAPHSLPRRILLDFPAATRMMNVIDEEFAGGLEDIRMGWEENNAGMMIQGIGEWLGGGVRMVGTVASYPIGLVGNLADMGADAMWDVMKQQWNNGGWGIVAAIALAIPTFILKVIAIAANIAAAIIDAIFKFFGETVIEGLVSWIGGAIGGRSDNESDLRTDVREDRERTARIAREEARRGSSRVTDANAAARAARNAELEALRAEIRSAETRVNNTRQAITRLDAMPKVNGLPRGSTALGAQLSDFRADLPELEANLGALRAELAALEAAPLPTAPVAAPGEGRGSPSATHAVPNPA
ncbi:MAG: hypothetical protein IT381_09065 [Deltaproteobacteria bacterium]|nr:hypothetical protein [Deltaproteobacteria bacterium]